MKISGSGFFDPGAGFLNHLTSTVSGSVKVAGVTYNSPTSVTLSLDMTAAIIGAKNVTITNPEGQSLTVSGILTIIKADQTITFTGPGDQNFSQTPQTLSATASSGLTVSFSIVSGPATMNGSNLTMTGAGTVVVEATQTGDSNYNAAPPVDRSFTVTSNYTLWATGQFTPTQLANPTISGPGANPDGDVLTNFMEYALGLDPNALTASGLPAMSATATDWVYTYTWPSTRPEVLYEVEVSTDLASWTTTGVTHAQNSTNGVTETWQASFSHSSAANAFLRLKVTSQ